MLEGVQVNPAAVSSLVFPKYSPGILGMGFREVSDLHSEVSLVSCGSMLLGR